MIEPLIVTLFLVIFLIVLFGGGALLRRRNIDMDGITPINKTLYTLGKLSIFIPWVAMVLQSWGVNLSFIRRPRLLQWVSLCLWALGFALLFIGRFGLGKSFRMGIAREKCGLTVDGLYRYSRNPMYLGIYATILASTLNTLNPLVFLVALFVAFVHHKIVLVEEEHLMKTYGQDFVDYCRRVRRYL